MTSGAERTTGETANLTSLASAEAGLNELINQDLVSLVASSSQVIAQHVENRLAGTTEPESLFNWPSRLVTKTNGETRVALSFSFPQRSFNLALAMAAFGRVELPPVTYAYLYSEETDQGKRVVLDTNKGSFELGIQGWKVVDNYGNEVKGVNASDQAISIIRILALLNHYCGSPISTDSFNGIADRIKETEKERKDFLEEEQENVYTRAVSLASTLIGSYKSFGQLVNSAGSAEQGVLMDKTADKALLEATASFLRQLDEASFSQREIEKDFDEARVLIGFDADLHTHLSLGNERVNLAIVITEPGDTARFKIRVTDRNLKRPTYSVHSYYLGDSTRIVAINSWLDSCFAFKDKAVKAS